MKNSLKKYKVTYNAPVTITFCVVALIALVLNYITHGSTNRLLFSVHRAGSPLYSPLTWLRFVTHVFGHADIGHYVGNITLILVLGPGLEERLGSGRLLTTMFVTALLAGIAEYFFFPSYLLLGASGIVFMMILMASLGGMRSGGIPLTLILVFVIYVGGEIYTGITAADNVSQLAHVIGGICGAVLGMGMRSDPKKK